jgi:O-antigen/teichoic acid export membrane protein
MQALMILYCRRHFPEAKLRRMGDRKLLSEMLRFAGWNFLGVTGLNIMHQGVNYMLNLTGGVVVNAARSITYQVMSGANTLVGNTNMAFKPQTNAAAAQKDKQAFHRLLAYNGKTAFVCYLLVVVPILVFAKPLVQLWLGQVPEYVIPFLLAISVYYLLRSLHELVNQFFISIGEMKEYQLIEFCTMILIIPLAWLLLKKGFPYWSVFLGMALVEVLNHAGTVWLAVKKYGFPIRYFAGSVYLPSVLMAILSSVLVVVAYRTGIAETKSLPVMLLQGAGLEILLAVTTLAVALNREERKLLFSVVKTWIRADKR